MIRVVKDTFVQDAFLYKIRSIVRDDRVKHVLLRHVRIRDIHVRHNRTSLSRHIRVKYDFRVRHIRVRNVRVRQNRRVEYFRIENICLRHVRFTHSCKIVQDTFV